MHRVHRHAVGKSFWKLSWKFPFLSRRSLWAVAFCGRKLVPGEGTYGYTETAVTCRKCNAA